MSLTLGNGPLSTSPPAEANYTIDGPPHRLLMTPFPRRVRAEFAETTVFETTNGVLVHESNLLPVLYVPEADVRRELLAPSDHSTHCPFKGDARYWSVNVGERSAVNAAWEYPEPLESVSWFAGLFAFHWDRLDRWFDEDEEVLGHLRDPYHRVDVRPSHRTVQIRCHGQVLAESNRGMVLSETGRPNRWYLPEQDVRIGLLERSSTTSHCPYKGQATYWNLASDQTADIAWSFKDPFDDARRVANHLGFDADVCEVMVEAG